MSETFDVTGEQRADGLARASELLVTTDMPVSEIAQSVGYADPFYFSRQFRSVRGCSPTRFRERSTI